MKITSTFHRSAAVVVLGVLTIGLGGTAGARIDRDIPTGSTTRSTIHQSVLDPDTDIATVIAAPSVVPRGGDFYATLFVSNRGKLAAREVSCGVSTPPADVVSYFALALPVHLTYDSVEGNESQEFRLAALAAGQTRSVRVSLSAVYGNSSGTFTISAYCAPAHVDQRQSNNASRVTVAVV